jgi:hypothetical protein
MVVSGAGPARRGDLDLLEPVARILPDRPAGFPATRNGLGGLAVDEVWVDGVERRQVRGGGGRIGLRRCDGRCRGRWRRARGGGGCGCGRVVPEGECSIPAEVGAGSPRRGRVLVRSAQVTTGHCRRFEQPRQRGPGRSHRQPPWAWPPHALPCLPRKPHWIRRVSVHGWCPLAVNDARVAAPRLAIATTQLRSRHAGRFTVPGPPRGRSPGPPPPGFRSTPAQPRPRCAAHNAPARLAASATRAASSGLSGTGNETYAPRPPPTGRP